MPKCRSATRRPSPGRRRALGVSSMIFLLGGIPMVFVTWGFVRAAIRGVAPWWAAGVCAGVTVVLWLFAVPMVLAVARTGREAKRSGSDEEDD